ncbi:hypothetical protein KAFR_0L01850 [Kazachstania africana CBS 2517]|uniref:Dol-P-Man:Man(5)GlcNAc(2)-PP-Dol alpha-1,3-mannosyltransferase n=1 Tax=Kazachstania africana (strain ATCC 22294 / BCRC 22015 / CBS 2517 / CECT 1963 / NBRC 1671 / NRRL Y-8276) TaxID=1071382 RepID=H2B2E5_KAZAF|nr:hypothetical protein KAFR_0L01850 [Kazachstania africana CBS 2517]CCF60795.1 hypothetical protein KAFR_0L01850 [Kazachstania africana CBS 2517]
MTSELKEAQIAETKEPEKFVRPPLDLWQDLKDGIEYLLFNPRANLIVIPTLLFMESAALKIIIKNVAYTEIDYKAYMEQIETIVYYKNLNYTEIEGGTGPLVYPAGHVMLYKIMHRLTDGMENLDKGQLWFRYLYMFTMLLQMLCYNKLSIPPWCVVLGCLSKRVHSIYVLRLFNDCFTTFFMVMTVFHMILAAAPRKPTEMILSILSALTYSMAVSIKMNALLYFPAMMIGVYIVNKGNLFKTLVCFIVMLGWQVYVALPFLKTFPMEYLKNAFNFSRQFMFEWSINWQFIGEEGFHNVWFQKSLLMGHIIFLLVVVAVRYPRFFHDLITSMKRPFSNVMVTMSRDDRERIVPQLLIITNFIGIIFARSLHYQFLVWYQWTLPMLLHWSQVPLPVGIVWYALHEYCWNVYPPNAATSALLLVLNSLLLLLCVRPHHTKTDDHVKKTI